MKTHKNTPEVQNEIVFLKGKKVTLRPLSENDAPLLAKWVNDPDVRQFVSNIYPKAESSEREWIESLKKKSGTDIVLGIVVKKKLIGVIGIHKIDRKDQIATTGALIGEKKYWGKGYGTDAKMAVLDYAFNTLNLCKIMSSVFAFNKRSLAYSLHCGYKIEGRLKQQRFVNGKYWDEIVLGLFKSDWLPYWKKYQM
jgi:RimJ/RimL family protein N-acetyltransferase